MTFVEDCVWWFLACLQKYADDFASSEDLTHDLEIMRLTRCLLCLLRYRGTTKAHHLRWHPMAILPLSVEFLQLSINVFVFDWTTAFSACWPQQKLLDPVCVSSKLLLCATAFKCRRSVKDKDIGRQLKKLDRKWQNGHWMSTQMMYVRCASIAQ